MDGIRVFLGDMITKLKLGWLVEKFMVNSLAVYLGSAVILVITVAIIIIQIKKAKQKKIQKEDYKYYAWMVLYLFVAFFVFSTKLYGIGNNVDVMLYILLLIVAPLVLMTKYKNEQQKRIIKEKELLQCRYILNIQKEQIAESNKYYENICSIKHDIHDHLKTMELLAAKSRDEECAEYLKRIKESYNQINMRSDTGNPYIDAIFTQMNIRAKSKGIRLMISCEGQLEKLKDSLSVSAVLNNALNNAIEACERLDENKDKTIDVKLVCRRDIILVVKNSCGNVMIKDGQILTSKGDKDNHGLGLKNIESAVKALGGIMQWKHDPEERQFTIMANWCQ